MRAYLLVAVIAASFVSSVVAGPSTAISATPAPPVGRIIGGKPVDEAGWNRLWGSVVSISWHWRGDQSTKWEHACTGVLVDPRLVLTARHCVGSDGWQYDHRDLRVVNGWSIANADAGYATEVSHVVTTLDSYEKFVPDGGDLALVVLKQPLRKGRPVPVATAEQAALWGSGAGLESGAAIAGYGIRRDANIAEEREFGPGSKVLNFVDVPILDADRCASALGKGPWRPTGHLCVGVPDDVATGEQEGRTVCYGDSGGPLIVRTNDLPADSITDDRSAWDEPLLVGIASRTLGTTCGDGHADYVNLAPRVEWLQAVRDRFRTGGVAALTSTSERLVRIAPIGRAHARARVQMSAAAPAGSTYAAQISYGGSWREIGRFRGRSHVLALPPSARGSLRLRVRRIDGVSEFSAGKGDDGMVVAVRRDAIVPSGIARLRATRQGVKHRLSWTRARDNDRVVGYAIEQRKPGGRWRSEYFVYCVRCEASASAHPETRSTEILLPGRRQFRVAAVDRAGNAGPWTVSGVTTPGPNA